MVCFLPIGTDAGTLNATLSNLGRLVVHLGLGSARSVENSPSVPAEQGGRLPIYLDGSLLGTAAFNCSAAATKSTGSIGSIGGAGATEAWLGGAGSVAGRLY